VTPEEAREISDPLERERVARGEMAVLSQKVEAYSAVRVQALHDLYQQLGSWRAVAERLGLSVGAVHKAAGR
jgi:hypothetical protein